jgi:hypothetical protein
MLSTSVVVDGEEGGSVRGMTGLRPRLVGVRSTSLSLSTLMVEASEGDGDGEGRHDDVRFARSEPSDGPELSLRTLTIEALRVRLEDGVMRTRLRLASEGGVGNCGSLGGGMFSLPL